MLAWAATPNNHKTVLGLISSIFHRSHLSELQPSAQQHSFCWYQLSISAYCHYIAMASLEDRISKPEDGQTGDDATASTGTKSTAPISTSGATNSWADETSPADANSKTSIVETNAEKDMSSLANAQTDGATAALNGSSGLYDSSYEVDVQLSDLQKQSGNPLASIKSFEELGL